VLKRLGTYFFQINFPGVMAGDVTVCHQVRALASEVQTVYSVDPCIPH